MTFIVHKPFALVFAGRERDFPIGRYTVVNGEPKEQEISFGELDHWFIKGCIAAGFAEVLAPLSASAETDTDPVKKMDDQLERSAVVAVQLQDVLRVLQTAAIPSAKGDADPAQDAVTPSAEGDADPAQDAVTPSAEGDVDPAQDAVTPPTKLPAKRTRTKTE